MILLDTDHLSVSLDERDERHAALRARMEAADNTLACTIVSVEELLRGWLAAIHRTPKVHGQTNYYQRLVSLVDFYSRLDVLPFNESAADQFEALRKQRVRVGTMDLKIASIAREADALLLSANLRDFERVPGLRVEDWTV